MTSREWMYSGWTRGKAPTNEWIDNTTQFLNRAFYMQEVVKDGTIKCPCAQCRNYFRHKRDTIELHLCKYGYKENYGIWTSHGERPVINDNDPGPSLIDHEGFGESDRMDNMLVDLASAQPPESSEEPAHYAKAFYRMVASADELIHENTTHSCLSAVARLLAMKSQYNMSVAHYDDVLGIIHEFLPPESKLAKDFYRSKKLLEGLGMPYVKIDVCYNNCMLYYKEDEHKEKCDFCGTSRYENGQNKTPRKVLRYLPIKDRLQRLYAHEEIARLLQSHSRSQSGNMVHPCDGEAWQQFDEDFQDFAQDPRNVRLALATDGFTPYSLGAAPYSCWPVFITPLNFPPGVCMRPEYTFLTLVIPGPEHTGKKLSVLMQPLVDELLKLWEGVETWDASRKQNFTMRAIFLWSIHDFPAYGIFAGWSTHGRLACPICMGDSQSFQLRNGRKPC